MSLLRKDNKDYSQSSGNTKLECTSNCCRDNMDTDSNMIEPAEFDSMSFLASIDELKTTLEPAVSCSDDLQLQELIEAVQVGNTALRNFQLFSLYAQLQIEDLSENLDAAVLCIEKMYDSLSPKKGSGGGFRLTRGKYLEGRTFQQM